MLGRQPTGGLTAQVGLLGLEVGGQLALPCIRQMNRVNSSSDFHDDSTINIVRVLLLLLLYLEVQRTSIDHWSLSTISQEQFSHQPRDLAHHQ